MGVGSQKVKVQESTQQTDSAPFIAFMLRMILDTLTTSTSEVTPEVTPEVGLLSVLTSEMTRQQLKEALGLKDDEHFRKAYLLPALEAHIIPVHLLDASSPASKKKRYLPRNKQKRSKEYSGNSVGNVPGL